VKSESIIIVLPDSNSFKILRQLSIQELKTSQLQDLLFEKLHFFFSLFGWDLFVHHHLSLTYTKIHTYFASLVVCSLLFLFFLFCFVLFCRKNELSPSPSSFTSFLFFFLGKGWSSI
jgi:ATP/ADP translocase